MKNISLGKTGIVAPQNGFGALPVQRVTKAEAVKLLRAAYEGGMTYFDTARAYSDSEEKLGAAFGEGVGIGGQVQVLRGVGPALFAYAHAERKIGPREKGRIDIHALHLSV